MACEIPTIDLAPFLAEDGRSESEAAKRKAEEAIGRACSEYGFFQVVNHGLPEGLMSRALEVSRAFFGSPPEEKLKASAGTGAPLPAGYNVDPANSPEKKEYVLMFSPDSNFNIYPQHPPQFKEVLEEVFTKLSKVGSVVENILNECLELPPNFLHEYNDNRSWDFMVALNYISATGTDDLGLAEHEDGNTVTLVFQDDVGGLQVRKNGTWIPIVPSKHTLIVNVGDVIQVLTNNKFKSATHRVVRQNERNRCSYAFFRALQGDKWVEPLPKFTKEMGQTPKYKGFIYKDYQEMRMRNKTHPPSNPKDIVHITHYAINN